MKRILTTAAVVLFAGTSLAACGGDDNGNNNNAAKGDKTTTSASRAPLTLTLVATNFKFDQATLTATAGDPVTFVIKNDADSTEHNLTIEDLAVNEDAEAGESATKTVESPAAGTYEYFCEYHPTQMKGVLTVS
jgi:plastocyanin